MVCLFEQTYTPNNHARRHTQAPTCSYDVCRDLLAKKKTTKFHPPDTLANQRPSSFGEKDAKEQKGDDGIVREEEEEGLCTVANFLSAFFLARG